MPVAAITGAELRGLLNARGGGAWKHTGTAAALACELELLIAGWDRTRELDRGPIVMICGDRHTNAGATLDEWATIRLARTDGGRLELVVRAEEHDVTRSRRLRDEPLSQHRALAAALAAANAHTQGLIDRGLRPRPGARGMLTEEIVRRVIASTPAQ